MLPESTSFSPGGSDCCYLLFTVLLFLSFLTLIPIIQIFCLCLFKCFVFLPYVVVLSIFQFSLILICYPYSFIARFPFRGKGFKIGTNETYNIKIEIRVRGILKIFCFCSHANVGASDKGISLKREILEKVFT